MNRLALSKGHYPAAKGASDGNGFNEHDEAVKWIAKLKALFKDDEAIEILEVPVGRLKDKIKFINNEHRRAHINLAIEIHFNSAARVKASGCETLYCPGSYRGELTASIIQRAMASIMPPNRGIKEGWFRMDRPGVLDYPGDVDGDETIDAFLVKTKCTALIIEPEFIQNRSVIEANRDICCEVIYDALKEVL